jgi:hypothetical protein
MYTEFVKLEWKDALRHLYRGKRIYTLRKYFRNAFARDAGLRIDHLLLSPSLKNRRVAGGVAREVRSWESRAGLDRTGGCRPDPVPEESAGLMARKLKTSGSSISPLLRHR